MSQIDYHNRLPRGRSYANNGSVKSLTIEKNTITAKVKGSSMYHVSVAIPIFSESQKTEFVQAIAENPAILSRIVNVELDPELSNIIGKHRIELIPRKRSGFKMYSSCPDWAVPCKNLAAVIYLVSRKIDKNPFLGF